MGNENGTWIMHGLPASDPECIHTADALIAYIDRVGFLPLFQNEIPGFSVEEHTEAAGWWSGDPTCDPWEWRAVIAGSGRAVYGKFFDKKAGFVSKEWFPRLVNYRRDGYDFDALWEDGKATFRQKRIMDQFAAEPELFSFALKEQAGFGKGGEKNFEGVVTALQMQTYLCVRDFRRRLNKRGEPYGWSIAVYATPETLWGYDYVTGSYSETPLQSRQKILRHLQTWYPGSPEKQLEKLIRV